MRKRRWFYVAALVVIAVPPLQIALTQLTGGYASSDQLIISAGVVFLLAPFVVVDFLIWCWRGFDGMRRLLPVSVVLGVIVIAYLLTNDLDLWCIWASADNAVCYSMQGLIVQAAALVTMVGALFIEREKTRIEEPTVSAPAS